jgi:predicted nucleic acid-binding protein
MRYLLDTGVLVRMLHRSDPDNATVRAALRVLRGRRHTFVTARQNVVEFWGVCTRPTTARGGFGLSIEETAARLRLLERIVEVVNEPDSTYRRWKSLVSRYRVSGRQVHDARIVAVMMAYRIKRVVTLNDADFDRYGEIRVVTPRELVG